MFPEPTHCCISWRYLIGQWRQCSFNFEKFPSLYPYGQSIMDLTAIVTSWQDHLRSLFQTKQNLLNTCCQYRNQCHKLNCISLSESLKCKWYNLCNNPSFHIIAPNKKINTVVFYWFETCKWQKNSILVLLKPGPGLQNRVPVQKKIWNLYF